MPTYIMCNAYGSVEKGGARAYWPLDENTGTMAYDQISPANNLTVTGATWVTGANNNTSALSFDGVNDYLAPSGSSTPFNTGLNHFSFAFWIKKLDTATRTPVMQKGYWQGGGVTYGWDFQFVDTDWVWTINYGSEGSQDFSRYHGGLVVDEWTHYLFTVYRAQASGQSSTVTCYRNGQYLNDETYAIGWVSVDNTMPFNIGRSVYNDGITDHYDYTYAVLDDIWFFNDRLLSASDALALYKILA